MEQKEINALLEKYWQAETTLEEERQLAAYFRRSGVPAELEPMRELFEWREEEALIGPGPDFDRRLLQRIGDLEGAAGGRVVEGVGGRVVSRFAFRFAAAAAIILCVGIGLLIPAISPGPGRAVVAEKVMARPVTDTYSDPEQALAAVRHALLVASVGINEGKHITQKNITRLHDSWRAVTGD
jgi:hypothetical protein